MRRTKRHPGLVIPALLALSWLIAGCDDHAPMREGTDAQNAALTQQRYEELAPAVGNYQGKMTVFSSQKTYDCVLRVWRTFDTVPSNSADAPTETLERPKLNAKLSFLVENPDTRSGPAVVALDTLGPSESFKYPDLLDPMGRYLSIMVDYGSYNPTSEKMVLPYSAASFTTGSLGELEGELHNGHFGGTWYSKIGGTIGSFDLVQTRTN